MSAGGPLENHPGQDVVKSEARLAAYVFAPIDRDTLGTTDVAVLKWLHRRKGAYGKKGILFQDEDWPMPEDDVHYQIIVRDGSGAQVYIDSVTEDLVNTIVPNSYRFEDEELANDGQIMSETRFEITARRGTTPAMHTQYITVHRATS